MERSKAKEGVKEGEKLTSWVGGKSLEREKWEREYKKKKEKHDSNYGFQGDIFRFKRYHLRTDLQEM